MTTAEKATTTDAWAILQAPFDAESVSLLPRATGDKDKRHKEKCAECGGYHEFPCIHLSYVGHADITMRFNEADPEWTWEPMGRDANGLPALDALGGLWAWLTILGVRKPAYGDPGLNYLGKSKAGTADGMKEAIGDMLRNGGMRFGAGTELWSKSDKARATLCTDADDAPSSASAPRSAPQSAKASDDAPAPVEGVRATKAVEANFRAMGAACKENGTRAAVEKAWKGMGASVAHQTRDGFAALAPEQRATLEDIARTPEPEPADYTGEDIPF
jgi:hypothetical protein